AGHIHHPAGLDRLGIGADGRGGVGGVDGGKDLIVVHNRTFFHGPGPGGGPDRLTKQLKTVAVGGHLRPESRALRPGWPAKRRCGGRGRLLPLLHCIRPVYQPRPGPASPQPSATSSTIITRKPASTPTVPLWECSPRLASGISSSTTT